MSARHESGLFTAALGAAVFLLLIMAARLESSTRIGPMLIAAGTLALLGCQLWRDLYGAGFEKQAAPAPRESSGFLWALLLPPLIWLLGCLLAVPLHTLLLVRFRGGRSWRLATVFAALTAPPIYGLYQLMLRPELIEGALLQWR